MYKNLKTLRQSLYMTQKEFATSLGIGYTTYNGYETGAREPKSDFWIAVAQKFNVTIDYLMGYSDDPQGTVAGTSKAPSSISLRLAKITSTNHLLKTLVDQYEGNMGALIDGIPLLSEEDQDTLIDACLAIITAIRAGAAVEKTATPRTRNPQAAPQDGKDTAPAVDGQETLPEDKEQ